MSAEWPGRKGVWRVGRKLGRTLYRDEVCVGMVDTPGLAAEIVAAMNAAQSKVSFKDAKDDASLPEPVRLLLSELNSAVEAEREACAKLVEDTSVKINDSWHIQDPKKVVSAIRARGKT